MLIIVGQAGGNYYTNKGGGSNYLCLPNDPDNGKPYSTDNDVLYGAEYEVGGSRKPSGFGNLQEQDVPFYNISYWFCSKCNTAISWITRSGYEIDNSF
jgi:hypothetical protein